MTAARGAAAYARREVLRTGVDGVDRPRVLPYLMDLETVNGTFLNGERLEATRFYELREKDVIKFGLSTREYVLLNDKSSEGATG
jgi:pSer/pThr/pTyr-binding forkhead associated (FHA) protein